MMNKYLLLVLFLPFFAFAQEEAWIYLADKENVASAIANPITILTQKAIERKQRHGVVIDSRDVPVNENYVSQLKNALGITVLAKSKWFNAVHVIGTQVDIEALLSLSFVSAIDFANDDLNTAKHIDSKTNSKFESIKTTFNYGNAGHQIEMINGNMLHEANYTGTGMTIAVMDAGFPNVNTMTSFQRLRDQGGILDSYDFVNRSTNVYTGTTSNHGTLVFSDMAGYVENQFVGTAPDASYYLFITENAPTETPVEESYWVEAAERADSLGVDIINTSLGYSDFDGTKYDYSQADMNGNTTFISRGATVAFEKGMLLVTSAGNSGSWGVTAPADVPNVFSIGAVDASENYATFSSVGTMHQTVQKPDVVAQGLSSYVITENDAIVTASGTSFSCPIMAGAVACLWQAMPNKTNSEIMEMIRVSASQYTTPDNFLGYGIPNFDMALTTNLSTDTETYQSDELVVFPNPVQNKLYLKIPIKWGITSITISNTLGKIVMQYDTNLTFDTVDLSLLLKGIYMVKCASQYSSEVLKVIKD